MALSKKNPRVQAARLLARDAKARAESGTFLVEGPKLVREALAAGIVLREVFVAPGLETRPGGASLAKGLRMQRAEVLEVDDKTLADLAALEIAQGIVAVAEIPDRGGAEGMIAGTGDLLLATTVQDPGNAGALVRIAAAAGFAAVIADRSTADFYSPKAVRGSAGSILRLPAFRVDDVGEFAERLAKRGTAVIAAATRGGGALSTLALPHRLALVLGGEGKGIPERLAKACTGSVTIPMSNDVESLNVATAAAVLAFTRRASR